MMLEVGLFCIKRLLSRNIQVSRKINCTDYIEIMIWIFNAKDDAKGITRYGKWKRISYW